MTNSCVKGKVIEREAAHWFRGRGCLSAERTEQRDGLGTSDVTIKVELPSFHIEVKGYKSPVLERSKLKKWCAKLATDCPVDKVPVLWFRPNFHKNWIALTFLKTYNEYLCFNRHAYNTYKEILVGDSINVHERMAHRKEWVETLIAAEKAADAKVFPDHYYYKVETGLFIAILDAEEMLHWMKEYEIRIKDGVGDGQGRKPDASSTKSERSPSLIKGISFGSGVYGETKPDSNNGSSGEEAA